MMLRVISRSRVNSKTCQEVRLPRTLQQGALTVTLMTSRGCWPIVTSYVSKMIIPHSHRPFLNFSEENLRETSILLTLLQALKNLFFI